MNRTVEEEKRFKIDEDIFGNKYLFCVTIEDITFQGQIDGGKREHFARIPLDKKPFTYEYSSDTPYITIRTERMTYTVWGLGEELDELLFNN